MNGTHTTFDYKIINQLLEMEPDTTTYQVTAVIQARMNSKRLPRKAMLDLAGKPLIHHVIERTKAIEGVDNIVLATTTEDNNREICDIAESHGIKVFNGSVHNVLERFIGVINNDSSNFIIRITGDNPFTDPYYASLAVRFAIKSGADLSSVTNIPIGTAVELIKTSALKKTHVLCSEQYHREHVTPFMKENPDLFTIIRTPAASVIPFESLRLTVDTPEDYKLAQIIYKNLYKGSFFSLHEVYSFLEENPTLLTINKKVKQKPMTQIED